MVAYIPFPSAPEAADARRIKKHIKRLLAEYLPTLRLQDRQGKQRLAAMKFTAALRVALRAEVGGIDLNDKRSLRVNIGYTQTPVKIRTKVDKYHWVVTVAYDRKSDFREITVLEPVELA